MGYIIILNMFLSYSRIAKSLYSDLLVCDKNYKRVVRFPYSVLKNKSLACIEIDVNKKTRSLTNSISASEEKSSLYSLSGPIDERHFYLTNLIKENLHPKLRSKPFLTQSQKIPVIRTGDRLLLDC